MVHLRFREFSVVLDADPSWAFPTAIHPKSNGKVHRLIDGSYHSWSTAFVRVASLDGKAEDSSCVVTAPGFGQRINDHSGVVHNDSLILAVGAFVVSLSLPTLDLNWKAQATAGECFGVYYCPDQCCYISHGEIDVARLSYDGTIQWTQSGADIFTNGFEIIGERVNAVDFNDNVYVWDIVTGQLVTVTPNKADKPSAGSGGF